MLSRRERCAMQLALEVLRSEPLEAEPALTDALVVLGIAHDHGSALCGVIERAGRWSRWPHAMWGMERRERLIRARLALYLRARLRADRGDCGLWKCTTCVTAVLPTKHCPFCERGRPRGEQHRRITPLWQRAGEARR